MVPVSKRKLRFATIIYWVLLFYIIAALLWWALSLERQNETMYQLRKDHLFSLNKNTSSPQFKKDLNYIRQLEIKNIYMYASEGIAFLALILIGAIFIYRSVRRQFKVQQQQQNFVMAITHELKTPIAVSRLNLETMQRHNLDEKRKEKLVQMTLQETLRLDTLINNILISSQLDGNSYVVEKEDLNFSDLATDVARQFSLRYPERILSEQISPEVDIVGDPLLLKLLISNLLENAHKYSSKEKNITLVLYLKENHVVLEVKDEGCGIKVEEKKNVFEKFYRIGNEQTRRAKGTGLGLFICKKIAEDHGAFITIADNQPIGSNFIVTF
ncbi:MAG: hypothetical protein NVS1B13_23170 [Flavisolibacter sp.]